MHQERYISEKVAAMWNYPTRSSAVAGNPTRPIWTSCLSPFKAVCFNKVSGTTGLTGSADATFVLEKEKRASDTAKLYVTGRDTPYQEYTLRFRDCRWELVERKTQEQLAKETIPDVLFRLVDFMRDKEEWIGTATELLAAMGETETIPTVITKWLNEYRTTFLSENRICYQYSRRKDGRRIALARRAGDSGDGGDSDIRIPPCYCH